MDSSKTVIPGSSMKRPTLQPNFLKFPTPRRLKAIEQYISSFEYRQSPQSNFNCQKSRPLARIMETAKMIIYNPQPIKCVEAVFLALFLTSGIPNVDRIPLSFKSELEGQFYQHIVLLIRYGEKYGAFGISREKNLMNKEFEFESISSIVDDYRKAYTECQHKLIRIRVGLPVEHNHMSFNFVCWRFLTIDPTVLPWNDCCGAMESHVVQAKKLWDWWLLEGQRENKQGDICLQDRGINSNLMPQTGTKAKHSSNYNEHQTSLKLRGRRRVLPPSTKTSPRSSIHTKKDSVVSSNNHSKKKSCDYYHSTKRSLKQSSTIVRCNCISIKNAFDKPPKIVSPSTKPSRNKGKKKKKMALKCYSFEFRPESAGRRLVVRADRKRKNGILK